MANIEAELAAGSSLRAVAGRYGISHTSLGRHLANHANPALVAMAKETSVRGFTPGPADSVPLPTLVEALRHLIRRAEALLGAAEAAGNTSAGLAGVRELRATLELLGRATGELSDRPALVINLVATQEWLSIRTTLLQVLARQPGGAT